MASNRTMQTGDTWPPLRGYASDSDGAVDLTAASALVALLKGDAGLITLPVTVLDPPLVVGVETYNWEAPLDGGDTDTVGNYLVQLKVTWQTGEIETFPNSHARSPTVTIEAANA